MNPKRLNQEVRWLGDLLGEVIRKMEGEAGFLLEERIRSLSKGRRNQDAQAAAELVECIKGLTLDEGWLVCRAFSIFFDLSNLAEDRHRVRTLREREIHNQVRPESLAAAIEEVRREKLSAAQVQEVLNGLCLEPVFTAHPTEAKRRAVRNSLRRIRRALNQWELSGRQVTDAGQDILIAPGELEAAAPPQEEERVIARPAEQRRLRRRLLEELRVLWLTDPLLSRRPTVLEEVDRGMYFMRSLWKVIPRLHRDLKDALEETYPDHSFDIPPFVRFGTWMGGDRDGNPFVTSKVTAETLRRLRRRALKMHARQAAQLIRQLTHSELRILSSDDLKRRLEESVWQWPRLETVLAPLSTHEVYRRWLAVIHWRINQSISQLKAGGVWPGAYQGASELESDLLCLRDSLHPEIHTTLEEWLVQLKTFGFHMAVLDIRQEASIYNQVLDKSGDPDMGVETLSLFRLLNWVAERYGPECLGCHILSMTHQAQDILNLMKLQETHAPRVSMPLVPLFETIRDLQRGPAILEELFSDPAYRRYLEVHANQQVVMIGYSDSTKDGGYLAANWALYQGQEQMLEAAAKYGIQLLFFHGRGGALGRGGGPAARSILSLPPHSTDTGMRLTEQGEVLSARYDDPLVAQRHLEQLTWALFQTQVQRSLNQPEANSPPPTGGKLMDRLAEISYKAYRNLVESPGFLDFFRQGTPIEGIEYLQIGSRPSRRSTAPADLSNLRAIPWVFAWTQNRVLLPAWYGLGSALAQSDDLPALQQMYRDWPFFTAVLDNAILALAKADFGIVAEYAVAVEPLASRELIWQMLNTEFQQTMESVLAIVGQKELLDNVPWLKRSIQVRNPYVDPLNLVQVETLRRLHSSLPETEAVHYRNLLRMTIQGIAGGLRTTG